MLDWSNLIRARLAALALPATREAEIAEELAEHAADRFAELQHDGLSEAEARQRALDEVTSDPRLFEELKHSERTEIDPVLTASAGPLSGLLSDLRYAFRSLRKNPGFAAVAVLILALGIGANTAIFSVVSGVLLQPLPYPQPGRLMSIFESSRDFKRNSVAYPNYLDWRRDAQSFVDMGIYRSADFNYLSSGEPEHLDGAYLSASLLQTLRVTPLIGRNFTSEEDRQSSGCSVLLSYSFWQQRFGGDPRVLGKRMRLNISGCSIVGVMRRDFRLEESAQVYLPIEQWATVALHNREEHPGLQVIARLKPKVTHEQAQSEMDSLCRRLALAYPTSNAGKGATVISLKDDLVRHIKPTLLLLIGAVAFVLVIACANVANLLLARSTGRQREFAIRSALGASWWRMARQLLAESFVLSAAAAALGLLLARCTTEIVLRTAPGTLPRQEEIGIDWRVLLFTLAASVLTAVVFGLIPAFHGTTANTQQSLKEGTRGAGGGRHRTEGIFVAVEVGCAVVLACAAGLMVRSMWGLLAVDPGLNPRDVLTADLALSPKAMKSPAQIRSAFEQLLLRVRSTPGVSSAALTNLIPLSESDNETSFWIGNTPQPTPEHAHSAVFYLTTPGYEETMQIPVKAGRFFTAQDQPHSTPVVVVDEVFARKFFPNQDPIGQEIGLMELGTCRIVGVVAHVKQWGLDADDTSNIRDQLYFPFWQIPDQFLAEAQTGATLVARTQGDPIGLLPSVRHAVAGPERDQPIYSIRTMEQVISGSLAERRFVMLLLALFGGVAVVLAATGTYALMSYAVTRRVREIGIRSALGASQREILALVLSAGMRIAGVGVVAGVCGAVVLNRFLRSQLYGVMPADPLTLAAVTLLMSAVALVACYVPARRAMAVDPMIALRCE